MSEFDKEKERERLREQYERDRKKREATEQMSELLLQGATMTNAHCSECGDPIFRYDGQEFCATCERPVERTADASEDEKEDQLEVTSPSDDTRVVFGDERNRAAQQNAQTEDRHAERDDGSLSRRDTAGNADESTARATTDRRSGSDSASEPAERSKDTHDSGGGLDAARESLVRTLVAHAKRAEAAGDPRQARDHLQAAREAAETLDALR